MVLAGIPTGALLSKLPVKFMLYAAVFFVRGQSPPSASLLGRLPSGGFCYPHCGLQTAARNACLPRSKAVSIKKSRYFKKKE